jgi:membrane associated rhomboid family serine protease
LLPLKDLNPTRSTPVVTAGLVIANVAVWILYELPNGLDRSILTLGFRPCEVNDTCSRIGDGWLVTAFTSMFTHAGWLHLLGNMLFLWIFGNNVEDALGHVRFLFFYVAGGLAATALQTFVTLGLGTPEAATVPNVGASGAIAAVLGAYVVLYPRAVVLTWIAPIFLLPLPALLYLVFWFVFQLLVGTSSLTSPETGGGVAYFAHIGGFAFGALTIRPLRLGRAR